MGKIALCNINYVDIASTAEYIKKAIVIKDNMIASIHDMAVFCPSSDIKCYDYESCWVIPGMIDMHSHVTLPYQPSEPEYYLAPNKIIDVSKKNLLDLRHIGITVCRDMGSYDNSAEWVNFSLSKDSSLPLLMTCGDILTYAQGHMHNYGLQICSDAEIPLAIELNKRCGCDFIKVTSDPSDTEACSRIKNPAFNEQTMRAIVQCATAHNLDVACHTYPSAEGVKRALTAGVRTIEHAVAFDESYGKDTYPNSYYVPTLATATDVCGIESLEGIVDIKNKELLDTVCKLQSKEKYCDHIPESIKEWLQILIKNLPFNVQSDQLLCIGSDSGCKGTNFYSALREMLLLSAFGATNQQVLTYAIINPCKALNLRTRGNIQTGFVADLIVLHKNPLEDITTLVNNVTVVCHGNLIKNNQGELL